MSDEASTADTRPTADTAATVTEGGDAATRVSDKKPRFSERLYLAWWAVPLPVVAAALLASSVRRGYPDIPVWVPYTILLAIAALVVVVLSKTSVRVTAGEDAQLRAGGAHLPLRFVGSVDRIGTAQKRKVLGPDLDPSAHVVHRAWVGPLVRIELTDPEDPTPYWLVSTRKPEQLARVLTAGRRTTD